jgi:hypothetical protein
MSDRTIASLARALTVGAAVTAAVAVLAPAAGAFTGTTYAANVQTPGSTSGSSTSNGAALVAALAAQSGGTGPGLIAGDNNVVQLCACTYSVPSQLAIPPSMQVEITGPPLFQASSLQSPTVSGQSVTNDLFTVASGDNVLFKGFNITSAQTGFAAIKTNAGNTEVDNMSLDNEFGNGMTVAGGSVTVNGTTITDNQSPNTGSGEGITQTAGTLTVNSSTIGNNTGYGISGTNANLNNNVFSTNTLGDCLGTVNANPGNLDDDGSCGGNADGGLTVHFPATFNGGPVKTSQITGEGSPGADNITTGCPAEDGRFFTTPNTASCDPGANQTGGTANSETAGSTAPVSCTVKSTNEITGGSGSSTQVVAVTDPSSFLGPDLFLSGTTNNGTISWPVVSGSTFDLSSPSFTGWTDTPTKGEFDITAVKTAGDATAHDTSWNFTAMDWLGNTKFCA